MSRVARKAAAAAEIRFVDATCNTQRAIAFAQRNADGVTSLGDVVAPNFASIQPYSQLQDLVLKQKVKEANVTLLPCTLTKLVLSLCTVRIDWESFRPLPCLQELRIDTRGSKSGSGAQLDDSFATVLPLLRVLHITPGMHSRHYMALETTAKVVMPHLVELTLTHVNIVHLDLRFMSALKSLSLLDSINDTKGSTVSAACITKRVEYCGMWEGTVLVTPNLR